VSKDEDLRVASRNGRKKLTTAQRVVVKVGTRVLASRNGRPDSGRIEALVKGIAELRKQGREVVLVSSGAVGMGMDALGLKSRPRALPELQMTAAVGQARLMSLYNTLFTRYGIVCGQVLLTHSDLYTHGRYLNARNTIRALLQNAVLPIVNENDVVATDEIQFGDNDQLAALTGVLVDADALVLLSTVSGFRVPTAAGAMRKAAFIERIDDAIRSHARGTDSGISKGGMHTKLEAVSMMSSVGAQTLIADGRRLGVLEDIFSGVDRGTLFAGSADRGALRKSRKRWLAFFNRAHGTIVVDDGACRAVVEQGKSLLAVGVLDVSGTFDSGSLVKLCDRKGSIFARGLVAYSSEELLLVQGHKSAEIPSVLPGKVYEEVIHRDNLAIVGM
jgi:glutamate 5-kinase